MSDPRDRVQSAVGSRYELEQRVGAGGMSTVYAARDAKHDRRVAIKTMDPTLAGALGLERFLKEIRLTAGLQHPYVLPLLDSGEADGLVYYVMPFVEGETLGERIARTGRLSVEEAVSIAGDVLEALDHAHRRGIVHRDIKPGNIMLGRGHALIADFGIATALEEAGVRLTTTGTAVGTPIYMSPEQVTGETPIDGRSDLYSLGCVLFEMLTGEPPFRGGGPHAVILRRLAMDPPDLSESCPDAPAWLAATVRRSLARDPDDRFGGAAEFAAALGLESGRATIRRGHARARRPPPAALVAIAIALIGIAYGVMAFIGRPREGPRAHDVNARRSFAVIPFRVPQLSTEEPALTVDLADELTRQLNGWREARAIPQVALSGLRFDVGLDEAVLTNLSDGLELARAAGVGTLVTLRSRTRGDTIRLEAYLYDAASGDQVGPGPVTSAGAAHDPYALVAPIASGILGFGGAPSELEALRRQSNDLTAVNEFREGVRSLERWDLATAQSRFETALGRDSTFALAHHYRALTLYWRSARALDGASVGAEIARSTGAAVRHSAGLSVRDSIRVRALRAFQAGEYDSARRKYRELIGRDSTDVYAWLLLGSVEYRDPWTRTGSDGTLRPRMDANLAMHAFSETVRLAPDFELGYGHLFDLQQEVSGAVYDGGCVGFEPPGGQAFPLFEPRRPERQVTFCPVVLDSVRWLSNEAFAAVDRGRALAGADSLLRSGMASVRRWAEYAPTRARPHEELASWYLEWRDRLVASRGPAARVDSVTRQALEHALSAAAARGDTSVSEFARLAALQLATGDRGSARALADRALQSRAPGERLPRVVAGVLVDEGRLDAARAVLLEEWQQMAVAVPGADGGFLPAAGVEPLLGELMALGSVGAPVDEIRRLLGEVVGRWRELYSEEQIARLKDGMLTYVGPVLLADERSLQDWVGDLEGLEPLWVGLRLAGSDPDAAGVQLDRSLEELESGAVGATSYLLRAILAHRIVRDSLALVLFAQADERPRSVNDFDRAWGLSIASRLERARSLERMGRPADAAAQYRMLLGAWSDGDPSLQPLLDEATEGLRRLEAATTGD